MLLSSLQQTCVSLPLQLGILAPAVPYFAKHLLWQSLFSQNKMRTN